MAMQLTEPLADFVFTCLFSLDFKLNVGNAYNVRIRLKYILIRLLQVACQESTKVFMRFLFFFYKVF